MSEPRRAASSKVVASLMLDGENDYQLRQLWRPRKTFGMGPFLITFDNFLGELTNKVRQLTTLKVFHRLPHHLTFTEFHSLPVRDVGAEIESSPASISNAMKELHELGIVEREGRGPVTKWRMTTTWGWRGDPESFHAFRAGAMRGKKPPQSLGEAGKVPLADAEAMGETYLKAWDPAAVAAAGRVTCAEDKAQPQPAPIKPVPVAAPAPDEIADKITQGLTLRVFLKLPKRLDFVEFRSMNMAALAAEMHTGAGAISRCMARLLEVGAVERQGRGPATKWRLRADLGSRGTAEQVHEFIERGGKEKSKLPVAHESRIMHNPASDSIHPRSDSIQSHSKNGAQLKPMQSRLILLRCVEELTTGT